jgi:cyclase
MRPVLAGFAIALAAVSVVSAQQAAQLNVLHVQGQVHLITGAGVNVAVQVGDKGAMLVDTPPAALVPQVMAEIRKLSPNPIRYIVNTSIDPAHWGGNAALSTPPGARGGGGAPFGFVGLGRPSIIAHENVLNRMANPPAGQPATPGAAIPTTTYYLPTMDFSSNGEAIILYHAAGITDSDSIVLFRESDVVSTGDIYTPGRYPAIQLQQGGSVAGLIAGLNQVLALAVPEAFEEGGTKIIPGHGRISEETDVAEFRDMIVIIRDRVQDLIKKGRTLEQIKADRPSRDYDAEYGASREDADRFVETIHRSLTARPAAGGRS